MASRKTIEGFVEELSDSADEAAELGEDDVRLAAAVLLVHASAVDGTVDLRERLTLHEILERGFGLDQEQLGKLVARAEEKDDKALDPDGFTAVLKKKLNKNDRMKILEMLFEIINADGIIHNSEGTFASHVEQSLGITQQDWAKARRDAAESEA